jgi:hypothetical protein
MLSFFWVFFISSMLIL